MSSVRIALLFPSTFLATICAVLVAAALGCCNVHAQPAARPRVALVIGVSAYRFVPALPNPANDARAVAEALTRLGFVVDTAIDPDRAAMESAIRRMGQRARGADAAVVFYAGHALEVGGHNWLLPTGTNPATERDLRYEALDMDGLLEQLDSTASIAIVMLDACRDNPFRVRFGGEGRGTLPGGGLAPARAATGTLIAFATAPGMVAQDGAGPHSPFTAALLRHIETPGLEVRRLMTDVRREVREATRGRQVPWEHSALEGDFYFKPNPVTSQRLPLAGANDRTAFASEAELMFWQGVRDSADPADLRAFLARFPDGAFVGLARNRLARLSAGLPVAAAATQAAPPQLLDRLIRSLERTGDREAAPYSTQWGRTDAQNYVTELGHKAIAVEPTSGRLFRRAGMSSAALAEQIALEGCQQSYGSPCVLLASDDELRSGDPRTGIRSMMPRIAYAGDFRPEMVPLTRPDEPPEAVRRYPTMTGRKAFALRAINQRLSIGSGSTEGAAAAAALAACNAEAAPVPCVLYAVGDRVILPQRRTEVAPDEPMTR